MKTSVRLFLAVVGTLATLVGIFLGLTFSGVVPPPYEFFGGWIGAAPAILGILGGIVIGMAAFVQDPK